MTTSKKQEQFNLGPVSIYKYLTDNMLSIFVSLLISKLFFLGFYFMLIKYDSFVSTFDERYFFHTHDIYDTPIHYLSLVTVDILIFSFLLRNLLINQNKVGNWIISIIFLVFTFVTQVIKFIVSNEYEEVNVIEDIFDEISYISNDFLLFNVTIIFLIVQSLLIYIFLTSKKFNYKENIPNNYTENKLRNIKFLFKGIFILGIVFFIFIVTHYTISTQYINFENTSEYIPKSNIKTVISFKYKNGYDTSGGIIPLEVLAAPTVNMILSFALKALINLLYILLIFFLGNYLIKSIITGKLKNKLLLRQNSLKSQKSKVIQKTKSSGVAVLNYFSSITSKFNGINFSISRKIKNILWLIWVLFHLFMLFTSKNIFDYSISWADFWIFNEWDPHEYSMYADHYDISEFIIYVIIPALIIFGRKYIKGEKILISNISSSIKRTNTDDRINDLKKYKELFDLGVISEEEFSEIKKKLL
jgi:hypothetical protein